MTLYTGDFGITARAALVGSIASSMVNVSCFLCFLFLFVSIENCSCGNRESSTVFSICLVLVSFFFAVARSGTNSTVLLRDSLFRELQLTLV